MRDTHCQTLLLVEDILYMLWTNIGWLVAVAPALSELMCLESVVCRHSCIFTLHYVSHQHCDCLCLFISLSLSLSLSLSPLLSLPLSLPLPHSCTQPVPLYMMLQATSSYTKKPNSDELTYVTVLSPTYM